MYGGVAHLGAQTIKCATPLESKFLKLNTMYGGVAHLGERLNGIQEVVGSIPIVSTKTETHTVKAVWVLFYPITPNITRTNTEFND